MWFSVYTMVVMGAAGVLAETTTTPEPTTTETIIPESITNTPDTVIPHTQPHSVTTFVRPVDCADHLMAGATVSGVYEIYPFTCTCSKPVLVWCDMETDGGGWTVFLNRQHQDVQLDFNRTWDDYKAGFGSPYAEHYLGNDMLHQMTFSRFYTIRLDIALATGGDDFETFQYFSVNSEANRYTASLTGGYLTGASKPNCLSYMNTRAFTTLDRDHDNDGKNCAVVQGGGAWWHHSCSHFNPTAPFNTNLFLICNGPNRLVTHLQLKLRPSTCDTSFKTVHLKNKGCGCAAPEY